MHWLVLALGVLVVLTGFVFLSQATSGVGYIGIGCFLAVAARIIQAEVHERSRRRSALSTPASE